ncbi:MAG: hypothetical protein MUD14_27910 [Hydrococcus sp. Prado102]|jgi:hypothetical protein|nr:hypothetical protein [Hydrococcus sp. Prado102]
MTVNSQVKIPTPSTNPISSGSYSRPSVPLSMYRELVQELETARTRIELLEAHNKQLVKENQQLILYVQSLQTSTPSVKPKPPIDRKKQVIEIVSDRYTPVSSSKNDSSINGWVLAIALMLIVVTSCLGAFLIVSSRLGSHR